MNVHVYVCLRGASLVVRGGMCLVGIREGRCTSGLFAHVRLSVLGLFWGGLYGPALSSYGEKGLMGMLRSRPATRIRSSYKNTVTKVCFVFSQTGQAKKKKITRFSHLFLP